MISRKPGFFERYYICRDTKGYCTLGFQISATFNRRLDDVLLSNALHKVIVKNPFFSMNFFRVSVGSEEAMLLDEDRKANGHNYELRPVKKFMYSQVVHHETVSQYDESVYEYLLKIRTPVDRELPTWQIRVFEELDSKKQYLLFLCNHALFDGNSSANFFEDLTRELDNAEKQENLQQLDVIFDLDKDSPTSVPPSSDNLVPLFKTPFFFGLWFVFKGLVVPKTVLKFFRSYFSKRYPNLYKNPLFRSVPTSRTNGSKFISLAYSPEEAKAILKKCKEKGLTLTPFMGACALTAMEEAFSGDVPHSHVISFVICGRRYFPQEAQNTKYGLYVSQASPMVSPGAGVEKTSHFLSNELKQAVENRHSFHITGLLRVINIWDYFKGCSEEADGRNAVEISNIGCKNFSFGNWKVEELFFSQGVSYSHITISFCSTPNGGLKVSLAYHEDLDQYEKNGKKAISEFAETFNDAFTR